MTPQRILVDGYNLSLEKGTGIATYARNLTHMLKDAGHPVDVLYGYQLPPVTQPEAREMSFFDPYSLQTKSFQKVVGKAALLATSLLSKEAAPVPVTGMVVDTPLKSRLPSYDRVLNANGLYLAADLAFKYFGLTSKVRTVGATVDIAHWTFPTPISIPGVKNIYTLHDLIPMRLPYTTLDRNDLFVKLAQQIGRNADHIITVSETSRRDIINLLGVPEDKVTNTWQSVDIPSAYLNKPQDQVTAELAGVFGLEAKRYYLFFGAIEPKKNLGRLIEAYLASGVEDPLIIVGGDGWKSEQEMRLLYDDHIRSLIQVGPETRVKRKIQRFDYAPFPLLISLIRGAKAVIAPSLYEGFGLPALESMMCGTPVITTNQGATPEVVEDGALLIDPYKTGEICQAILAVDKDPDLRGSLVSKGKKRAAYFTKERHLAALQGVYDKVKPREGE